MPKAKARRRSGTRGGATQKARSMQPITTNQTVLADSKTKRWVSTEGDTGVPTRAKGQVSGRRPALTTRRGSQNLITAACIALGCWGFAFSYTFLTKDANRYVYGGMAAVLAGMWTVFFALRLRKWLQQG